MATSAIVFFLGLSGFLILGQLQRIEIVPWPAFYLHDLWMAVWAIWLTFKNKSQVVSVAKNLFKRQYLWGWLFVIWVLVGWLVNAGAGDFSVKALFYALRFLTYGWVFFWLWKTQVIKPQLIKLGLLMAGFWLLLGGLGQYFLIPDMRFLSILGWDDHYFRLVGTQFDPNFIGIIFVLLFLHLQTLTFSKKYQWLVGSFQLLLLLGLALTFSRSAFLSFAVAEIFLLRQNIKKYWPILALAVLIVVVPKPAGEGVVLTRTASIEARLATSRNSVANLNGWGWVVGQGLFATNKNSYADEIYLRSDHAGLPDNLALTILEGTGLVGLALLLLAGWKVFLKLARKNPTATSFLVAVLVHSMFNNSLFQPFVFLVLGLSLVSEIDS